MENNGPELVGRLVDVTNLPDEEKREAILHLDIDTILGMCLSYKTGKEAAGVVLKFIIDNQGKNIALNVFTEFAEMYANAKVAMALDYIAGMKKFALTKKVPEPLAGIGAAVSHGGTMIAAEMFSMSSKEANQAVIDHYAAFSTFFEGSATKIREEGNPYAPSQEA